GHEHHDGEGPAGRRRPAAGRGHRRGRWHPRRSRWRLCHTGDRGRWRGLRRDGHVGDAGAEPACQV
ncbi:MAG: hypothetical protein AVDCRST_MAG66-3752, partial [uncultured Pseudonocardia sp.]